MNDPMPHYREAELKMLLEVYIRQEKQQAHNRKPAHGNDMSQMRRRTRRRLWTRWLRAAAERWDG